MLVREGKRMATPLDYFSIAVIRRNYVFRLVANTGGRFEWEATPFWLAATPRA